VEERVVMSIVTPPLILANPAPGLWPRPLIAREQDVVERRESACAMSAEEEGRRMQDGDRVVSERDQ
jgi:hypothetical protein